MRKFAVKLTKNDDVQILGACQTKEQAMELGIELRKQYSRDAGLLAVIEAEFTDDGKMISPNYKLHEVIR